MPTCRKCGEKFPNRVRVNGVMRMVNKRVYCLSCSPFGKHNTKRLEKGTQTCQERGEKSNRRSYCPKHYVSRRRARLRQKVSDIVGCHCKICGYGGADRMAMLDFHHVDPSAKCFSLTIEGIQRFAWSRVVEELKKCVILCCRCHREQMAGLISDETIREIHREMWGSDAEGSSVG